MQETIQIIGSLIGFLVVAHDGHWLVVMGHCLFAEGTAGTN
jgi:hypothetical protein